MDKNPIPAETPVGSTGSYHCYQDTFLSTGNVEGVTTYDVECRANGPNNGWVFPAVWPECVEYKICGPLPDVPSYMKATVTPVNGHTNFTNGAVAK